MLKEKVVQILNEPQSIEKLFKLLKTPNLNNNDFDFVTDAILLTIQFEHDWGSCIKYIAKWNKAKFGLEFLKRMKNRVQQFSIQTPASLDQIIIQLNRLASKYYQIRSSRRERFIGPNELDTVQSTLLKPPSIRKIVPKKIDDIRQEDAQNLNKQEIKQQKYQTVKFHTNLIGGTVEGQVNQVKPKVDLTRNQRQQKPKMEVQKLIKDERMKQNKLAQSKPNLMIVEKGQKQPERQIEKVSKLKQIDQQFQFLKHVAPKSTKQFSKLNNTNINEDEQKKYREMTLLQENSNRPRKIQADLHQMSFSFSPIIPKKAEIKILKEPIRSSIAKKIQQTCKQKNSKSSGKYQIQTKNIKQTDQQGQVFSPKTLQYLNHRHKRKNQLGQVINKLTTKVLPQLLKTLNN